MPSEFRTPRTLAAWFELDYFGRRRLFRGLWAGLPLWAAVAALFGLALMVAAAGRRTFQSGPLSTPHAMFNDRCDLCHDRPFRTLSRMWNGDAVGSISDEKCLACHTGSPHHAEAKLDRCVSCHKEHRGHAALARLDDRKCVECHGPSVTAFTEGKHPPFREVPDAATIQFNHAVHLGSPKVEPRLDCADCHRPDAAGRHMLPVTYESHCAKCHPISVKLGGEQNDTLPHPSKGSGVAEVRAAIHDRLARFIAAPGSERFLKAKAEAGRLPLPASSPREERAFAWVNREAGELERVVFDGGGGCRFCHTVTSTDRLPVIAAPAVPVRWRKHATFRHDAHRMMGCDQCHEAKASEKTSDVLLPRMELCLKCHDRSARGAARADCVECHVYHDPASRQAARGKGGWSIEEILGRR